MLFYLISAVLISLITILYGFIKYRFTYWERKQIPHKKPKFPKAPVAIITDLNLIRLILIKDFEYFSNRGMYHNEKYDPLSANLVTIDADKWKNQRTKISPTFSSGKMKFMFPTIKAIGQRLTAHIEKFEEKDLDIYEIASRYTIDVIGAVAFGIECDSLSNPNSDFYKYGIKGNEKREGRNPLKMMLKIQAPNLARYLGIKDTPNDVIEFFVQTVDNTINYRKKNNVRRNDFMDIMIEMKNQSKLSFNEIIANCYMFFSVGYDTSSITLAFCIYELVMNSEIQDKIRKEIRSVLDKHNGDLSWEALMEMPYLEQVLKETLRKYPVLAMLGRVATKNYKIPNSNYIIEKGIPVIIPIYEIHHDENIYPNSKVFDPERFSDINVEKRHPMAFLGFGDGPRNCIGMRFAKLQTKIALISILNSYKLFKSDKLQIPLIYNTKRFLLSPQTKVWIKFKKL
ncbi:probable cytochrome P450 6a20 isoform X2 [Condylostylus longicornis]|uniref:probable cytochrome P450 6a20 isoform X2 n=1 Tax=Condylostylus longicornis TaxID=2530218 RepID=UPI00244E5247|nr:probable cytochrome P450 6a20 isoform X2 [Condylostylus longicornis]